MRNQLGARRYQSSALSATRIHRQQLAGSVRHAGPCVDVAASCTQVAAGVRDQLSWLHLTDCGRCGTHCQVSLPLTIRERGSRRCCAGSDLIHRPSPVRLYTIRGTMVIRLPSSRHMCPACVASPLSSCSSPGHTAWATIFCARASSNSGRHHGPGQRCDCHCGGGISHLLPDQQ